MYDVSGKLILMNNGIKSIYINSLPCVRVKGSDSECFRIDSGLRQECIISPWLFNVYLDAVMKQMKMGMGRRGESGYCLASRMQITWFCVKSRKNI